MSRAGEATSCEFKKTNKRQWNTNARQRSENKRGQLAFPRHVCVDGSKSGGAPVCHVELLEHLICGRRADRPTFRDSHELLAKLSKALLSRKIIWFRVPITLIRVRLFTSKFNRIFLVSTHLSKPQKHYSTTLPSVRQIRADRQVFLWLIY